MIDGTSAEGRGKCCAVRLANDCDAVPTAPPLQGGRVLS